MYRNGGGPSVAIEMGWACCFLKTVSGELLDIFQVLAWKNVNRGLCQAELPSGRVGERKVVENMFFI